jgi:hypothetical protein
MTPEQIATLPDDLLSARHAMDIGAYWNTGLVDLAAERICYLEEQLLKAQALAARLREVADTDAQLMAGRFLATAHDETCWRRHGRCAVQRAADLLDGDR